MYLSIVASTVDQEPDEDELLEIPKQTEYPGPDDPDILVII